MSTMIAGRPVVTPDPEWVVVITFGMTEQAVERVRACCADHAIIGTIRAAGGYGRARVRGIIGKDGEERAVGDGDRLTCHIG